MNVAVIHGDEQVLALLKKFVEKIEEEENITPRPSENVLFTTNPDDVLSLVKEIPFTEAISVISSGKLQEKTGLSLAKEVKLVRRDVIFILYTADPIQENKYVNAVIENDASPERTRLVARSIIDLWQMKAVRKVH